MMTHNADLATAQLIGRVQRQDLDMDDLRYLLKSPSTTAAVIREVSLAEGWWLHQALEYCRKEIRVCGHLVDCGPDADKHRHSSSIVSGSEMSISRLKPGM